MTKLTLKKEVCELNVEDSSAEDVIVVLQDLIEVHRHGKVSLDLVGREYSENHYIAVYVNELETDEEWDLRVNAKAIADRQYREVRRAQYERLKKEFGNA